MIKYLKSTLYKWVLDIRVKFVGYYGASIECDIYNTNWILRPQFNVSGVEIGLVRNLNVL